MRGKYLLNQKTEKKNKFRKTNNYVGNFKIISKNNNKKNIT